MTTQSSNDELTPLPALNAQNIKISDLPRLPTMTGWFEPLLLLKLLLRVIISDVFGQYADRRLVEAALDRSSPTLHDDLIVDGSISPDEKGAVWIDYVSDLGDGFDATYAVASLLAVPILEVGEHKLPKATIVVMGGDEVYPTALRDHYKVKMRLPYELAWPVLKGEEKTPLFALPGNHDWYDGLVNFLAIFCREKPTKIGGWITHQRRSYFGVKIAENWWIWGIDIALVRDMDQPQADYFVKVAKAMPQGANVILCSAEPGWYEAEAKGDSYRTLSYAALIAKNAKKDLRIPIVLSGDSHHYARYQGDNTQYITSGGGGAFLHGTLELKPAIEAEWLQSPKEKLTLAACYPSKELSSQLLAGNWQFGQLNRGLTWALSGLYLVYSFVLTSVWRWDVGIALFLTLIVGLYGYARYQEGNRKQILLPSLLHASAHMIVILGISWAALLCRQVFVGHDNFHWLLWLLALALPTAVVGPWISGKIYGLSLWLGCKYFNINHNDAFSSMQLDSHRHFIRIRIHGDEATIYPIKLERAPSRDQWQEHPDRRATAAVPIFIANPPLKPELIESPVVIQARTTTATAEVKTPPPAKP